MATIINADTSDGLKLTSDTSGQLELQSAGSTKVTMDATGNVGIGTASPTTTLDVETTVRSKANAATNDATVGKVSFYNTNAAASANPERASIEAGRENSAWGAYLKFTTSDATSAASEAMRIDSSGNLKFNSGYGSVATAYGCRAWVNFNGTGAVAIRASGNVSSITDNGTGDYTVNFTTAMSDVNYSAVGNCSTDSSYSVQFVSMFVSVVSNSIVAPTTSNFRVSTRESSGAGRDEEYIIVSVHR
jgi:hypothetical protein